MIELHKKRAIISFSQHKIIEFYEIMETESKTHILNILHAGPSLEERRLCDASNENTVVVTCELER